MVGWGSDAVGQAEARLAGGQGLNVPHNKVTVNFSHVYNVDNTSLIQFIHQVIKYYGSGIKLV